MPAWWSEEKINATVNREYVWRELGSKRHQENLNRPLAFGHSLTNDTYLDWIILKGKRLFLILDHIGLPECIFQVLDRSLDDDDLPFSEDALNELNIFRGKSETLDKKFYRSQFKFLVKELDAGHHVDYEVHDIVPVEPLSKRPSVSSSNPNTDRVYLQERLYTRKRASTSGCNGVDRVHFVMQMKGLQTLKHPHLVSMFASYTQNDFSYMLLTPSTEINLKTFFDEQPKSFKHLGKEERRVTLFKWTHCLTSALAYLHSKDFTHQSIRPSSILVSSQNVVYLSDFWALKALDNSEETNSYKAEVYNYAAPENWQRKSCLHETMPLKTTLPGGGRTTRRLPSVSGPARSSRSGSISTTFGAHTRTRSITESSSSSTHSKSRNALITTFAPPSFTGSPSFAADVFSMTAILTDIMSLLLGHSLKSFATHRSKHNRLAGRGGAPADASFHKNLAQVETWVEALLGHARGKERGFRKAKINERSESMFYASVVGVLGACRSGLCKETSHRPTARELEKDIRRWVDRGLGAGRRWCCGAEAEEVIPGMSSTFAADEAYSGSDKREKSVGADSPSSFEIQLPIERPMSLMENYTLNDTDTVGGLGDEVDQASILYAQDIFVPGDENWPLGT